MLPNLGLGGAATLYAAFLNTERGKRFAQEYTAVSVIIGTALVLLSLRTQLERDAWNKVAAAFVVAGVPIAGRSVLNKWIQ